jgi:hypothetical protein
MYGLAPGMKHGANSHARLKRRQLKCTVVAAQAHIGFSEEIRITSLLSIECAVFIPAFRSACRCTSCGPRGSTDLPCRSRKLGKGQASDHHDRQPPALNFMYGLAPQMTLELAAKARTSKPATYRRSDKCCSRLLSCSHVQSWVPRTMDLHMDEPP